MRLSQTPEWSKIKQLVQDGNKIEAIKVFREITGAGLKESKDAVEKIQEGRGFEVENYAVLVKQVGLPRAALDHASQIHHIGELLKQGKKIEAIEAYQVHFNVSKDDAVEAITKLQSTIDTPGAFEIHPPTGGKVSHTYTASTQPNKTNPFTIIIGLLGIAALVFACYALAIMDEYDTMDISVVFRGTATYTPEPTEEPEPTEPPRPTDTPLPTSTPEIAIPSIIASCIGNSPTCFEDGRFVGVDGAGNIYAGEGNGRVQVFNAEGDYQTEWSTIGEGSSVRSMAVDRQGVVYVVQGGIINRYNGLPGGDPGSLIGPIEYEPGPGFQSIAVTVTGQLVAAWNKDWQGGLFTNFDKSQDDVVIFDKNGEVVRVIPQLLSVAGSGGPELSTEVGVDYAGNIYASGAFNPGIFKFSPEGKLMDKFGVEELGHESVLGIAADGQGRVYVTASELRVFDSQGKFLGSMDYGGIGIVMTDEGDLLAMDQNQLFRFTFQFQP